MTATFDNTQADAEGWGIFECSGSVDGRWQLQRCDEADVFDGDGDAWTHVVWKAVTGSAYHQQALDFLRDNNPSELVQVMGHYGVVGAALWLQEDARYLYSQVDQYRDAPGKGWIAHRVQCAAAASAVLARRLLRIEVHP